MLIDIIGVSLIIIFFIRGYMKGIIVAAFSVIAILLGFICALKLSSMLAAYLLEKGWVSSGWAQILSYAILFIGIILLVRLIAKAIEKSIESLMMGWVNRALGGVLYAFMAAVIWSSGLWLGNQMHLIEPETIAESKTYEYLAPVAPWFCEKVGLIWPMAKDLFGELQSLFSIMDKKGA
jgi:membrane protein required for colicin V production